MATNGIKTEGDSPIKHDPDMYEDEDKYVDDEGELQIPGTSDECRVWLAKLPKWLWEAWADMGDDDEIEIGRLRIYDKKQEHIDANKMKLVLHQLPNGEHAKVPKKYDITLNRQVYNNTVVFSEKDQQGFKSWRPNRIFKREERQQQAADAYRVNKHKKYTSAIPKKVALAGYVLNEVTLTAVENAEYERLSRARFEALFKPKHLTTISNEIDRGIHPSLATSAFNDFTTAGTRGKPLKKKQTEKNVRISQEDLLDALNACFKDFRYNSLKALKQRLRQPEAYIKSVVEKIATLVRSGPFTGNYRLNPEYEQSLNMSDRGDIREEAAEERSGDDDDEDDDDDEGDFEDVKMEDS